MKSKELNYDYYWEIGDIPLVPDMQNINTSYLVWLKIIAYQIAKVASAIESNRNN